MTFLDETRASGGTSEPSRRRAALFDMDRTLVRRETASLYVRWQIVRGEATFVDLARTTYWALQYTFGLLDAERVAARVVATLQGQREADIVESCEAWFPRYVEQHIAPAGREAVRRHRERGDLCAIVTGASAYASRPLASKLDIPHVVSSIFEVDAEGRFTGRPESPLCYGEGKLARAERLAQAEGFRLEDATFYTDSITDLPLLERVGVPIAVNPDPRLTRVAQKRGWAIQRW